MYILNQERAFVTEQLSYFLCKFFLNVCIYEQDKAVSSTLMSARCIFISMLIERRVVVVFRIHIKHHLFTRLLSSSSLPPICTQSSFACLLFDLLSCVFDISHSFFFSSLIALCLCRPNMSPVSPSLSLFHSLDFLVLLFLLPSNKSIVKKKRRIYLYTLQLMIL
jgi:hypothetical protein